MPYCNPPLPLSLLSSSIWLNKCYICSHWCVFHGVLVSCMVEQRGVLAPIYALHVFTWKSREVPEQSYAAKYKWMQMEITIILWLLWSWLSFRVWLLHNHHVLNIWTLHFKIFLCKLMGWIWWKLLWHFLAQNQKRSQILSVHTELRILTCMSMPKGGRTENTQEK